MLKVKVLYLRYGRNDYPGSLERLVKFYSQHIYLNPEYLIIDNSLSSEYKNKESVFDVIGGDNLKREFTGWDIALKSFNHSDYDLIHFVTSAFQKTYDGYLDHFYEEPFIHTAKYAACLGHVDKYPDVCRIGANEFQSWIRTCFYFMSPTSIKKVDRLTYHYDLELLFSRKEDDPFGQNSGLSNSYKKNLINWLTGEPINGVMWHSFVGVDKSARELFIKKCESIILEQTLSIRMRKLGIKIIDIGYLYSVQKKELFQNIFTDLEQAEYRKRAIPFS